MGAVTPLPPFSAAITLPPGVNLNVTRAELQEFFRLVDSTAFSDGNYTSSIITGQEIRGQISGWMNTAPPGMGTIYNAVAITFAAAAGCVVSGTFNITGFHMTVIAAELSTFQAEVISTGPYSISWTPQS